MFKGFDPTTVTSSSVKVQRKKEVNDHSQSHDTSNRKHVTANGNKDEEREIKRNVLSVICLQSVLFSSFHGSC